MQPKIHIPILILMILLFLPRDIQAQWAGFAAGVAQEIAPQNASPLLINPSDRTIIVARPEASRIFPFQSKSAAAEVLSRKPVTSVLLPRIKNVIGYEGSVINPLAWRYTNDFVIVNANSNPRLGKRDVSRKPHSYGSGFKVGTKQAESISHTTVVVGSSRDDVIRILGRPNITIINAHGETLIFKQSTVIIQNGIVEIVH